MHAKPKSSSIYPQNINQQWFDAELKAKYLLKELSGAWLCQNPILIRIMALKCQLYIVPIHVSFELQRN